MGDLPRYFKFVGWMLASSLKNLARVAVSFYPCIFIKRDFLKDKTVKTNDKTRRFGVVMAPLSR